MNIHSHSNNQPAFSTGKMQAQTEIFTLVVASVRHAGVVKAPAHSADVSGDVE